MGDHVHTFFAQAGPVASTVLAVQPVAALHVHGALEVLHQALTIGCNYGQQKNKEK